MTTTQLGDTKVGDRVRLYLDAQGFLVCSKTERTAIATVVKILDTGGRDLGWQEGEQPITSGYTQYETPETNECPGFVKVLRHRGAHVECEILPPEPQQEETSSDGLLALGILAVLAGVVSAASKKTAHCSSSRAITRIVPPVIKNDDIAPPSETAKELAK